MEGYLRIIEDGGDVIKSKLYWAILEEGDGHYLSFYPNKKDSKAAMAVNLSGKKVSTAFNTGMNCEVIQIDDDIDGDGGTFKMALSPNEANDFGLWKANLANAAYSNRDGRRISKTSNRDIVDRRSSNRGPTPKPRKSAPSTSNAYNSEYDGRHSQRTSNGYPEDNRNPNDRRNSRRRNNEEIKPLNSSTTYASPNRTKYSTDPRRQSNVSNTSNNMSRSQHRPYSNYNQRYSRASQAQSITGNMRNIETVKEDPSMADDEVLISRLPPSVLDNPKRMSIPDSMKRWSIAATDLVGKSVEELYLMLIQLNRHKANLEVWTAHMEQNIELIDEELSQNLRSSERETLELEKSKYEEDLNKIQELEEMCDPLTQLLDSVVQMSGVYGGNNQMFHVVYHNEPADGNEDFTNIEFVRHNQERQVAKLLDDYRAHNKLSLSANYNTSEMNGYSEFPNEFDDEYDEPQYNKSNSIVRKSLRQKSTREVRENTLKNLPLNHSDSFISENRKYTYLLEDIDTSLLKMDSVKTDLQKYMDIDSDNAMNVTTPQWINDSEENKENFSLDRQHNQPITNSIHSLKQMGTERSKLAVNVHKPKRSSRKSPKSDMTASLNRLSHYKKTNVPFTENSLTQMNDYIRYSLSPGQQKRSSSYSNRNSVDYKPSYVNQQVFQQPDSEMDIRPSRTDHVYANPGPSDMEDYERGDFQKPVFNSKVQNRLQDILNTQPYNDDQSKSSRSKHQPIRREYPPESPAIDPLVNGEPLIKLNMSLYSAQNNSRGQLDSLRSDSFSLGGNSDMLNASYPQNAPIEGNQRMHLNQVLNDDKMWKNPSKSRPEAVTKPVNNNETIDNYMLNTKSSAEKQADFMIGKALHNPEKISIRERYQSSDVDEMSNYGDQGNFGNYGNQEERSSRIRKMVAASKVGNDGQPQQSSNGSNYRESQLLQQSFLAKEASRRSREL